MDLEAFDLSRFLRDETAEIRIVNLRALAKWRPDTPSEPSTREDTNRKLAALAS